MPHFLSWNQPHVHQNSAASESVLVLASASLCGEAGMRLGKRRGRSGGVLPPDWTHLVARLLHFLCVSEAGWRRDTVTSLACGCIYSSVSLSLETLLDGQSLAF